MNDTTHAPSVLTVIGSINQDYFTFVDEFPRAGETILATSASVGLGGKGCNQAVAAAKLGQETRFIGAVGADAAGTVAVAGLDSYGVDTNGVARLDAIGTGAAYIAVSASGENTIIVHSGANAELSAESVRGALGIVTSGVLLIQGELTREVNDAVAEHARARSLRLISNAAPVAALSDETLAASSPLIVNETEAADLLDRVGLTPGDDPERIAEALQQRYTTEVVVTLGAAGAVVATAHETWLQPSPRPDTVVDTTGAGDGFVGVLAASLCAGHDLRQAVLRAVTAASHSVSSRGIGDSYATAGELEILLAR